MKTISEEWAQVPPTPPNLFSAMETLLRLCHRAVWLCPRILIFLAQITGSQAAADASPRT